MHYHNRISDKQWKEAKATSLEDNLVKRTTKNVKYLMMILIVSMILTLILLKLN